MATPAPYLLLGAAPEAAGAAELVRRFAAGRGGGRRVLLAGQGLAWARHAGLGDLADDVDVAVCSQDARRAGWTLAEAPAGVRWSSVGTWLAELPADAPLWVALP